MGLPDDMDYPHFQFPRLKFAGLKPVMIDTRPEQKADFSQYAVQDPAQPQGRMDQPTSGQAATQNEYDKLASDMPGEELAPDSSIWRIYTKEAKEHDRDLVDRRDKNLDTMLLFATLFSAILTAFLIESMTLLQPNPSETSVALLLNLAQSQWRIETGNQQKLLPMLEIPLFQPSASARWINALWFMALAFSLGAAMIAMIAKEWLQEFVSFTVEHPYEYMLKRQARLDKLLSWHTLPIVDLLPTILHLSLVLFALGLLLHLWLLDRVIGMTIVPASAALSLLYLVVVGLGMWKKECPFQTRLSTRIWRWREGRAKRTKGDPADITTKSHTTEELRALRWLMTKSRDPAVGDSAFQALAGWKSSAKKQDPKGASIAIDDHYTVVQMGTTITDRLLNMLLKYPRELAFCRGTNAARYASALPEIYRSACLLLTGLKVMNQDEQDLRERLNGVVKFKKDVFNAIDTIWNDDCPPFTASVYAKLTTAELRLSEAILSPTAAPEPHDAIHIDLPPNIETPQSPTIRKPDDIEVLRVRCSRALCRAALQLAFHSKGAAPIGKLALTNLLEAISSIGKIEKLDSKDHLITHYYSQPQPQPRNQLPTPPQVPVMHAVVSGDMGYHYLRPNDIGDEDGLLAVLTNILGGSSLKAVPTVEIAAIKAMGSIGPKIIKQWVELQCNLQGAESDYANRLGNGQDPWSSLDSKTDIQYYGLAQIIVEYLVKITHFAITFINRDGICSLPDVSIKCLYTGVSTRISAGALDGAYDTIVESSSLKCLKQWLRSARYPSKKAWSLEAKTYLLRLLAIRNSDGISVFEKLLSEKGLDVDVSTIVLWVLETVSDTSDCVEDVEKLLRTIISSIGQEPNCHNILECFTHKSEGYKHLRKIGSRPKYAKLVATTSVRLMISLHKQGDMKVQPEAALGFLSVVSFVCKSYPPQRDDQFEEFLKAMAPVLASLLEVSPSMQETEKFASSIQQALGLLASESDKAHDGESKKSFQSSSRIVAEKIIKDQKPTKLEQVVTAVLAANSQQGEGMTGQAGEGNDDTQNIGDDEGTTGRYGIASGPPGTQIQDA